MLFGWLAYRKHTDTHTKEKKIIIIIIIIITVVQPLIHHEGMEEAEGTFSRIPRG